MKTSKISLSAAVIAFVAVMLVAGVSTVCAQTSTKPGNNLIKEAGILPTSPFYFLESWSEQIGSIFTFNPIAKAKRMSKLAEERLAEASVMASKKQEKAQSKIARTMERYQRHINSAMENVEKAGKKEGMKASQKLSNVASRIASSTLGHQRGLARAYKQVSSEQARSAIREAMQKGANVHQRASKAFRGPNRDKIQAKMQEHRRKVQEKLDELRADGVPVPEFAGPGPRQGTGTPSGRPEEGKERGQGPLPGPPSDRPRANTECSQDIAQARQAAEGKMCTQQVMWMQCPHNKDKVHMASNGCEISSLKSMGWEETSRPRRPQEPQKQPPQRGWQQEQQDGPRNRVQ